MKRYSENRKRICAMILAAAVFGCVLFMLFFMANEMGHDCSGEDCEICFCLEICEELVFTLRLDGLQNAFVCMVLALLLTMTAVASCQTAVATLITKKVRLNN